MPVTSILVHVSGRVQGVSFRAWTANEAKTLGVVGWVRNLPDGRVQALLQGESEQVEALLGRMRRGPSHAKVTAVERAESDTTERCTAFSIVR